MPTERPQQTYLFWLINGLVIACLIAWQPQIGPALLAGLTLAILSLALAHDFWSISLPNWRLIRRGALLLGCGVLGLLACALWPLVPLVPVAGVLLGTVVLHRQRGHWANTVDRLTGLPTAAAFAARGEPELSRGLRFSRPSVVAVITLDNANELLAMHGREALHRVTRRVAEVMREHSRSYDLLGRLGDARFAILLPETTQEEATIVTARIRAALGGIQSLASDGKERIALAASIGLAVHPWGGDSIRALVNNAEASTRGRGTDASVAARPDAPKPTPTSAQVANQTKAPIAVRRFNSPTWAVPAYIAFLSVLTGGVFAATFSLTPLPDWPSFAMLCAIGLLARNTRLPLYGRGSISFQFVPLIAASVFFEPTYAFIIGGAVPAIIFWGKGFRWQAYTFDIAQFALIAGVLALAYDWIERLSRALLPAQFAVIPEAVLLGGLSFVLNALILIAVMSLHEGANPLAIWRERIGWFFPYTIAFGFLGVFMAWSGHAFGPLGIVVFAIPAFMIHLVTKQYVDRTKEHVTALHEAHDRLAAMNHDLRASVEAVERSYTATLSAFSGMLDARDSETEGHSQRVVAYAVAIAQALHLDPRQLAVIEIGALLHDIGKVGIPDAILRKPGKLSDLEWAEMRRHPEIGYQLTSRIPFLDAASPLVRHHHERWDGTGYPAGLRGEDIPLAARIFAVADSYDALVSDRPYRPGRSHQEAIAEIRNHVGTQFDPQVVAAFLQVTESDNWSDGALRQGSNSTIQVSQLIVH